MPDRPEDLRSRRPGRDLRGRCRDLLADRRRSLPAAGRVLALAVAGALVATALVVALTGNRPARPGAALAAFPARLNATAPPGVASGGGGQPGAGRPTVPGPDGAEPRSASSGGPGPEGPVPGPGGAGLAGVNRDSGAVGVYAGLGAWVDAYDFSPAYIGADRVATVQPRDVDAMAAAGVTTLYLQASRLDDISTGLLVDPPLLAEFLLRAHGHGMRVVGWYLPRLADVDADLARLTAVARFRVLDHRFDGIAVDIEDTTTVPDLASRNLALVALSQRLRGVMGSEAIGAIVLPPVLTEVVNPRYWPEFPWSAVAPLYDVWLPMSYWTFRKPESGYRDGYGYNVESIHRLRTDLGSPQALVHAIGGIADLVSPQELDAFLRSLADAGAIGGSLYDWATLASTGRAQLADGFAAGPGAGLPRPP